MRKEKEIRDLAADKDSTLVRKGTRINSIIQKIKILSKRHEGEKSGLSPIFDAGDEDEAHISFSAEDPKQENHSVNIKGSDGLSDDEVLEEGKNVESGGLYG